MLRRNILLACATAILLAGCGEKRPLIAPQDIPAHEEKLRKKREKFQEDMSTEDGAATGDTSDKQDAQ